MMKNLAFAISLFSLCSIFSIPAFSQTVLQEAVVNGKIIELLDDKTWRYKSQRERLSGKANSNCPLISEYVRFCVPDSWKVGNEATIPGATAFYLVDGRHYALFTIEELGTADGASNELLVLAAHTHAATGMNIPVSSLEVLFTRPGIIDGRDGLVTAYSGSIEGLTFTFINNIYVGERYAMQAVIYGIGGMTSQMKIYNSDLLTSLQIID
ncbi:MAG: hypothetical protein ACR2PW_05070 [Gammaproteobacteria bacterium]